MKRDPHFHDLSRDHHHALVLARRAEAAAEDGSSDAIDATWEVVAQTFDADLAPHFEVEERHLLPPMEAAGQGELVRRTRADHQRLRALRASTEDARERLREFGQLLREHVRFEENELFPTAEATLSRADLDAMTAASAATAAAQQRAAKRARTRKTDEGSDR